MTISSEEQFITDNHSTCAERTLYSFAKCRTRFRNSNRTLRKVLASREICVKSQHQGQSSINDSATFENRMSRENSVDQITIQRSEGFPVTGQQPKNDLFHRIGEDVVSSGSPVD
jgi:hypothetical protein